MFVYVIVHVRAVQTGPKRYDNLYQSKTVWQWW